MMSMPNKERPACLCKPGLSYFVSSEDIGIIQRIQWKHGIENLDFNFKPMVGVINNIFHHALFTLEMVPQENGLPEWCVCETDRFEMQDNKLRITIHQLSWEIICKSSCGKDAQEATFSMLDLLRSYSWEAKAVLVLAAFAMTYGQFWTSVKPTAGNPLAQSVCLFLQPPCLLQKNKSLISRFQSLKNLVKDMLVVADHMVELKELTKKYKTQLDVFTTDVLQSGVYWIITSVYTCLSYNMNLVKMDFEYLPSACEIQVILDCSQKLAEVRDYLSQLYKQEKDYLHIKNIFERPYGSVEQLLSAIYITNLTQRLDNGYEKVSLDYLNGKTVAFFITYFDVSMKDFKFLETTYNKIKETKNFEIVWIPTVDQSIEWNNDHQKTFDDVAASMPWLRLCDHSSVHWAFMQYIQQQWHFDKKPILVILGEHDQGTNINVLPTVEIWNDITIQDEETILWKKFAKPIWQLLLELQESLKEWVEEGRVVCFYGGHDYEWVKEFRKQMADIKHQFGTRVKMEIIYIGTRKEQGKLQKIMDSCWSCESKSQSWDLVRINKFWRLLTYLYDQRMTHCKVDLVEDPIMKELMTISTYDSNEVGWAIMFGGSSEEMVTSSGRQLIQCLTGFKSWGWDILGPADFVSKLNYNLCKSYTREHCTSLIVPATATSTDARPSCLVCGRPMRKSLLFKCCIK